MREGGMTVGTGVISKVMEDDKKGGGASAKK
jgi:hypothetical protein